MKLKETYEKYKKLKVPSLSEIREKASQHSKTSLFIVIILVAFLLLALHYIPHFQVDQFNITNPKDIADAENSYRATLAQIFGGVAIGIGLYYTWRRVNIAEDNLKVTQENLKAFQEGQITERFTRAVDQLGAIDQSGNPAIEIRLGGIYALERISKESDKDYWLIMEILTAYVRKNSSFESSDPKTEVFKNISHVSLELQEFLDIKNQHKLSEDIQTILTIIKRRKNFFFSYEELKNLKVIEKSRVANSKEPSVLKEIDNLNGVRIKEPSGLDLNRTYLRGANLSGTHLEGSSFEGTFLESANLESAQLILAYFGGSILRYASLKKANLYKACLAIANLEETNLEGANLKCADLGRANLRNASLKYTNLTSADLDEANLTGVDLTDAILHNAKGLSLNQLSKVASLYNAKLDEELEVPLKEKYPTLFGKSL